MERGEWTYTRSGARYPFEIPPRGPNRAAGADRLFAFARVARHDAPIIGERAATLGGRSAPEGGDKRDGVQSAAISPLPANVPRRNARGARRDQGRARSAMTYRPTWR